MGPAFRLVVEAEAGGQVLRHLVVTVGHDPNLYRLDPACFTLPCLVPVSCLPCLVRGSGWHN